MSIASISKAIQKMQTEVEDNKMQHNEDLILKIGQDARTCFGCIGREEDGYVESLETMKSDRL